MGSGEKGFLAFHRKSLHKEKGRDHNHNHIHKGFLAVKVGQDEKEQKRFIIPVMYLKHPLFIKLLNVAEDEYGYEHKGVITIPCHVEEFLHVRGLIDKGREESSIGCYVGNLHQYHSGHNSLAGCFRA